MIEIKRDISSAGCAFDRPTFVIFVDGREVGFHRRLWMARAIGAAIEAGHIPPDGDTTRNLSQWAEKNDAVLYAHICATRADGLS